MSYTGTFAQRLAFASLAVLLCMSASGFALQETSRESPASPVQAPQDSSSTAPAAKDKPADTSKDDTGVDIDALIKKKKKEERKPDFEIRAVRTSPSDTVTYFKPNHWTLFHVDMVANNSDETVEMRTGLEPLLDTPHAVQFRRRVHLLKEQDRFARMPVFLPEGRKGKSVELALYHTGGVLPIQPPGIERQPCTLLDAEQFLIVALSATPDNYRFLNGMQCIVPGSEVDDDEPTDRRRYFHVIAQFHPTRPIVADSVLAWTTTSYVIWDDLDPALLSKRQQDALVDWLHWGGQLIVSGGSDATRLEQSFLAEYLPADVVGSAQLSDLTALSASYHTARSIQRPQAQVKPINILPGKPVYMARLAPRPEADPVEPRDKIGDVPLVVERRVGRGRVVMAAFSLYQPELVQSWKDAYDTFWRDRLFRIRETAVNESFQPGGESARTYVRLPARQLSGLRFLARDFGAGLHKPVPVQTEKNAEDIPGAAMPPVVRDDSAKESVAEWRDNTPLPNVARQSLLAATGIKIPPPEFVLTSAILYLVALVPLNWLICRFGFRRPELAWLISPVIILAFSIAIVKLAQVNVGYDSTSHEINVVEMFANYPRAHVSRFTCVYSGSRQRCEFRYDDSGAVALPMVIGKVQRGQDIERLGLDWEMVDGVPVALRRYEVHPRSIGMVRAEEMRAFAGAFSVQPGSAPGEWRLHNETQWELWDCRLITPDGTVQLGDMRPGDRIQFVGNHVSIEPASEEAPSMYKMNRSILDESGFDAMTSTVLELGELSPEQVFDACAQTNLGLGLRDPAERMRLVGWAPRPVAGQEIDPVQDQSIGFTVFVVHL